MSFIESLPQGRVKKGVGFKPKGKPRGRQKGWRKQGGVVTTIRVSENLKAILDSEHKPGERYNDTVERILIENTQTIDQLEWKNANLESENERLRLENEKIKKEKQIEMNVI